MYVVCPIGNCRGLLNAHHYIATNNPASGVYICADRDLPGRPVIALFWSSVLLVESVLLCMSIYRGWRNWKSEFASSWISILTEQSIFYFIA